MTCAEESLFSWTTACSKSGVSVKLDHSSFIPDFLLGAAQPLNPLCRAALSEAI